MKISNDRLVLIQNQLAESNILLEKYHSKITTDCGRLGFRIIGTKSKFNKIDFVNLLVSKDNYENLIVSNVAIPKEDAERIARSKSFEYEIICNFEHMFSKIAIRWSSYTSDICLSKEDLESEAMQAAIFGMYSYTDKNINLSTYLYHCVVNKIRNICNKTNSLSDFGSNAIEIRHKFEKAKKDFGDFCTYDEVVQSLNFSKKEIQTLQATFITTAGQNSEEGGSNDYSSIGKSLSGLDGSVRFSCSSNGKSFTIHGDSDKEESLNVDVTEFSELEKAVLEGFMNSSSNLGISNFAKNLINPKTGDPYSRMAITYAWRRVKEKIIKKHSNAA